MYIRLATHNDIDAIMAIQNDVYSKDFIEDSEIFLGIIKCNMSFVAIVDDNIVGFILVHPSDMNQIHLLNVMPHPMKENTGFIFIHDLSILRTYHGHNIGTLLCEYLKSHVDYKYIQLISVNDTKGFWQKQGFVENKNVGLSMAVRMNYGNGDIYFMEYVCDRR